VYHVNAAWYNSIKVVKITKAIAMKKILILLLLPAFQQANAQVSFSYAPNVPVGAIPAHMIADDFDNDGKIDLATANRNTNTMTVFMGDGFGNFNSGTNYVTGNYPNFIASADFNGDGNKDMVVLNAADPFLSVYLGIGGGLFSAATNYFYGYFVCQSNIACADFDNDGNLDLLVSTQSCDGRQAFFSGNGLGGFSSPVVSNYLGVYRTVVDDFDNDGILDIVTTNGSFAFWINVGLGNGSGTFPLTQSYLTFPGDEPKGIISVDFDEDGFPDIATANELSNDVALMLGDGLGAFDTASVFSTAGLKCVDLANGDFNNDGHQDLAVVNYQSDNISVLLGDGIGGFSAPILFPVGDKPVSIVSADFDGDGDADLAVANDGSQNISIFLNIPVCVPFLTINTSPFYTAFTESQSWVITSGIVLVASGSHVVLDADLNSYVTLHPGFKVDSGAVFVAQAYNGCTAGAPQLPQERKIANANFLTNNEIVLYPNPTSGLIHIKHDKKLSNIQIFDMVGKLIINQKCNGETETNINLSHLPNGVYHVKAVGYNSIRVVKNE
jgi:hypothetical protein